MTKDYAAEITALAEGIVETNDIAMARVNPARAVPEWVGATPDSPVPMRVKVRVFERFGGYCHRSKVKIHVGDQWDVDHVLALINGGENRESNLAPILKGAHKAKTAEDVAIKAKTARIRAKHLGVWPRSKRPLKSRGFEKTREPVR